jgi:hypothetical protein
VDRLFWVHVPKAGTSFGLALLNLACPALPKAAVFPTARRGQKNLGQLSLMQGLTKRFPPALHCPRGVFEPSVPLFHHGPLKPKLAESGRGMMLLRDPRQRLYSGFQSLHADGMPQSDTKAMRASVSTAAEYASYPGIEGCQVKMLTGNKCAALVRPTLDDLAEAKRRLTTALGFVGLTEYYNESVCLLHAMFDGGPPRPSSFSNSRPTAYFQNGYISDQASGHLPREVDPLDADLFAAAEKLFVDRLVAHGFKVPAALATTRRARERAESFELYGMHARICVAIGLPALLLSVVASRRSWLTCA